jgi:hypothetical protein
MYALIKNNSVAKYPIGLGDLKKEYPNTSFPSRFSEFDLTDYGVVEVVSTEVPSYNPDAERVIEGTPSLKDDVWEQVWVIEPLSAEEQQQILNNKVSSVRSQRDRLLQETDWVVIKAKETDTNLSAGFKEYRQALRDITEQEGFPHNIIWPIKPNF